MGIYDAGIAKMTSSAPISQQSEQYGKEVAQSDKAEGTKLGTGDFQKEAAPISEPSGEVEQSKYMGSTLKHRVSKYGFKQDTSFYGHYLPGHFKKTNIISTKGRV